MKKEFYSKKLNKALCILWLDMEIKKAKEAMDLLWAEASDRNADAWFFLSRCYMPNALYPGFEVVPDTALAEEYLRKSRAAGSVLAAFYERAQKGSEAENGFYRDKLTQGEIWDAVLRRAKNGDAFCQMAMGDLFYHCRLEKFWEPKYSQAELVRRLGWAWRSEAGKWYEQALFAGFSLAGAKIIFIYSFEDTQEEEFVFQAKSALLNVPDELYQWLMGEKKELLLRQKESGRRQTAYAAAREKRRRRRDIRRSMQRYSAGLNGLWRKKTTWDVYPFGSIINGEPVPYGADMETLTALLKTEMKTYVCALRVLAWRNTEESFGLLRRELGNKDGFRRRAAFGNLLYHGGWAENALLAKSMLLDDNPYVVKLALGQVNYRDMKGVDGEVLYAMEQYQNEPEVQKPCLFYFRKNGIDYRSVLEKRRKEREENNSIPVLEGASQGAPEGNLYRKEAAKEYFQIIRSYVSEAADKECEDILLEISVQGCGYASLVAALLQYGEHRTRVWESKLGELDFERLLLHFYCMTKEKEYNGMPISKMEEHFYRFCNYLGIAARLSLCTEVSEAEVRDNDDTTYYLLLAENFALRDETHERIHVQRAHAMNLADIREFDTFYVYSWGQPYTLRKKDIRGRYWFVQVKFLR